MELPIITGVSFAPVVLQHNNTVILLQDGKISEFRLVLGELEQYHELKDVTRSN